MKELETLIREALREMSEEIRLTEDELETLNARIFGNGKEAEDNG